MERKPLSSAEEDQIAMSWMVCLQADTMPKDMVERHGMILDFYLEAAPTQTHAILNLIGNLEPEDLDD
jgi:hypothetical protein